MQLSHIPQSARSQTVHLSGALNANALDRIRHLFDNMVQSDTPRVILDLSDVHKLDASGVGALVFLFKRLRNEKRELKVIGVHGQPEAIIRLLRMEKPSIPNL